MMFLIEVMVKGGIVLEHTIFRSVLCFFKCIYFFGPILYTYLRGNQQLGTSPNVNQSGSTPPLTLNN